MASNVGGGRGADAARPPREIFRCDQVTLRYDDLCDLLIVTRSPLHWTTIGELHAAFDRMDQAIAVLPKHRTGLLIDSREAPLRNDPVFESEFEKRRRRFIQGFKRIAALVMTAVGRLQIQRHSKIDNIPIGVFTDLAEAREYLELPDDYEFF
jgi:hypothetical protein